MPNSDRHRDLARALRKNPTDAEQAVWRHLRGRNLAGFRFRRQHPLGPYVLDLVCLEAKLVVELDGGQHGEPTGVATDAARTAWLAERGYRVARFWNHEAFGDWDTVEQELWRLLTDPEAKPYR